MKLILTFLRNFGILNPKGCSSKHGAEEEPGLHQVLQPHGVHRGHGPGASRHPGVNLIKLFSLSLRLRANKLDCLPLTSIFSLL